MLETIDPTSVVSITIRIFQDTVPVRLVLEVSHKLHSASFLRNRNHPEMSVSRTRFSRFCSSCLHISALQQTKTHPGRSYRHLHTLLHSSPLRKRYQTCLGHVSYPFSSHLH